MTEEEDKKEEVSASGAGEKPAADELDSAGKSLSEALRVSFIILKVIMVVLVLAFLVSGLRKVGSDEKALVLRFGKIRGVGEKRVLGPGPKLLLPYPIHEVVKIPVEKTVNLTIDSFCYQLRPGELLGGPRSTTRIPPKLNPVIDGYCITRSDASQVTAGSTLGYDYNIIHCVWQLTYQVANAEQFFKNVYVEDVKPGQIYFDVMKNHIKPLLEALFEDAVVSAVVNYTVDDVMFDKVATVTDHVRKLLQGNLDKIESGIEVVSIQLEHKRWPRQVEGAFLLSLKARQDKGTKESEAKADAERILNEAAGPVGERLYEVLMGKAVSEEEEQYLWDNLAGEAEGEIAEARAYRRTVVETAKANAVYLQELLPEFRKRPELVIQEIYWDAMEKVLRNVGEKFIIQPAEGVKGHEIRVIVDRDQRIKRK
jgi:membrane protease subunit HflK